MSTDQWLDKEDAFYIYGGILLSYKKEWNNVICSNLDGTRGYYTKYSKLDKDKYHMILFICGI